MKAARMLDGIPDPLVSIVLPALKMNNDFLRCVFSIRAALAGKVSYEIVSVVRDIDTFSKTISPDLYIFEESGPGIYQAMNFGLEQTSGRFVYFIGQDDILLPESAKALVEGEERNADVILGNVFWGKKRIRRNFLLGQSLVWTNWCHQGVFYRRKIFMDIIKSFPVEYVTQADHYTNIILRTNRAVRIIKYDGSVAWYSAAGLSTRLPDLKFRADFPALIRKHFGIFSYSAVVLRRTLLRCIKFLRKIK